MKFTKVFWILVAAFAVALALPTSASADSGTPIPGQYIVVLKNGASGHTVAAEHARSSPFRSVCACGSSSTNVSAKLGAVFRGGSGAS